MKKAICKFNLRMLVSGCCCAFAALGAEAAWAQQTLPQSAQTAAQADSFMQKITVGSLVVYSFVDSKQIFSKTLFKGIDQKPQCLALMPEGKFAGVVKTYFLQSADHKILFDAGWGKSSGHSGNTLELLDKLGVQRDAVTDIFLTHMDSDHISGLLTNGMATYPKAVLRVAKKEFDAWMKGAERKTQKNELARSVAKAYEGRIELFEYGQEVLEGIIAKAAFGHTPGHTCYDIDSDGVGMTIVGDLMHVTPIQMRWTDYSNNYDGNPQEAAATREAVLKEMSQSKRIVGGMHFEQVGVIVKSAEGGYKFAE